MLIIFKLRKVTTIKASGLQQQLNEKTALLSQTQNQLAETNQKNVSLQSEKQNLQAENDQIKQRLSQMEEKTRSDYEDAVKY